MGKVLRLLTNLNNVQAEVLQKKPIDLGLLKQTDNIDLGELQSAYQTFFEEYQSYLSSVNNGFLLKKKTYLLKDLDYLQKQQQQLTTEKTIEQRDFTLATQEFNMHKKLADGHVETQAEFRQEESKYLAKRSPLVQTESSIIGAKAKRCT